MLKADSFLILRNVQNWKKNTVKQNMEDKWSGMLWTAAVKLKKLIMVFFWFFCVVFFAFGSYLDRLSPEGIWLVRILASLQGTRNCQEELEGGREDAELQDSLQSLLDRSVSHYSWASYNEYVSIMAEKEKQD